MFGIVKAGIEPAIVEGGDETRNLLKGYNLESVMAYCHSRAYCDLKEGNDEGI